MGIGSLGGNVFFQMGLCTLLRTMPFKRQPHKMVKYVEQFVTRVNLSTDFFIIVNFVIVNKFLMSSVFLVVTRSFNIFTSVANCFKSVFTAKFGQVVLLCYSIISDLLIYARHSLNFLLLPNARKWLVISSRANELFPFISMLLLMTFA